MANTVLTTSLVAKEALRILNNELGVLSTFHRAHESEFKKDVNGYLPGESISINRPADYTIRTGATMNLQDSIEGKVTLTVDTQKGVDLSFTSVDLTLEMSNFSERFIRPAIINLVNEVARDCFDSFYPLVYNWVGTPGQTLNSVTDFVKAPERLDEMAVPMADRHAVLSPADHWGMAGGQSGIFVQDIARDAIRRGSLGELGTCETWMSQVVPTHTNGTQDNTTPVIDGASQEVTYDTAKNTWTQTLITDGWDGSSTITAGTVFTIAGVNMVNPKTKANTGILQHFTVTEDVTANASAASDTTLTISPPIIVTGPHQTVDASPADDATITTFGAASTSYKQNLAYAKGAFALAMVPMEIPQGAVNVARETMDGMSIRIVPVYDGVNDVSKWRLDVLYGKKTIDPRIATRFSGTA